ncbi:MAG TPA: hypothetical protein VFR11_13450 [Micromonosporaceae bacterium]|jgi:hypothetical protein|nr:hypothetical protein [Micromonosporaceae bacterium]
MFLRLQVAALNRWRELTHPKEIDRGDSPVPTVIMWIGIAVVAVGLIAWVGLYVTHMANHAPGAPATPAAPTVAP